MFKYLIEKTAGGWGLINRQTGKVAGVAGTMKAAKAHRIAMEAQPDDPVESVTVGLNEKVAKVTHANWSANMDRAHALRAKMAEHVRSTGGFPSHRTIQTTWGYNISLKALCRHKHQVMKELHLRKPKTTLKIR